MNFEDSDRDSDDLSAPEPSKDDDKDDSYLGPGNEADAVPTAQKAAEEERQTLARQETKAITALRVIVLLVLLCTGAVVSWATFAYTRSLEEDDFESSFSAATTSVLESFHSSIRNNFNAMDSLSSAVTDYALSTESTFPNVTMPGFHLLAGATRIATQAIYIFYIPLVTDETRRGYEAYCWENQGYLFPSFLEQQTLVAVQDAALGLDPVPLPSFRRDRRLHFNVNEPHPTIHAEIYSQTDGGPRPPNSGPYFPAWQSSPVVPSYMPLNLDFGTFAPWDVEIKHGASTGKAVLGVMSFDAPQVASDSEDTTSQEVLEILNAFGQYRHGSSNTDKLLESVNEISAQFVYPVFDKFGPDRQVAGMLTMQVFWFVTIENILPEDIVGVVVVFENGFGQVATYRIDGARSTFLGIGDLHDTEYDDWAVSVDVAEYLKSRASPETQSLTLAELDDSFNNYRVTIYPSDDMESSHVTNEPIIFTIVMASVFVFCALVFVVYDCMVERRQRLVLNRAVQSTAVVSSLFPKNVRERLMEEHKQEEQTKSRQKAWGKKTSTDQELKDFLDGSAEMKMAPAGKPIADHFDESTILFGDLVGFTKWSSTRKPEDVFHLLETIFGAFDAIALKRKVFKVETIGDCYVAVTGVPEPQTNHAVIMIRFARESMSRLRTITQELRSQLGDDTVDLNMRVGIHSGPITAGVLRGEKGRFQLFGDTINTASRMESTGRPGSIQVSEATASCLKAAGKSHWLVERKDKVMAKGKGEMTTYFIAFGAGSQQHTSLPSVSSGDMGPSDLDFSASSFGALHGKPSSGSPRRQTTSNSPIPVVDITDYSSSSVGGIHSNLYTNNAATERQEDSPVRVKQALTTAAVDKDFSSSSYGLHSNMYPSDLRQLEDSVPVQEELEHHNEDNEEEEVISEVPPPSSAGKSSTSPPRFL